MLPRQFDMFATAPSTSLVGLQILMSGRCQFCGSNAGVLGSSRAMHYAAVICTRCNRHRGWLSRESASFINSIIDQFGRPTAPIVVRNKSSSH
jgi:hypothetical protein